VSDAPLPGAAPGRAFSGTAGRAPMFPLGTVLLPHSVLPLHVFEARYRELVRDCLRDASEFGVVLIERGSEVGGGDTRFDVGTMARIGEARRLPGGRWVLLADGVRRIRVERWMPDDPYPVASVRDWPDEGPASAPSEDSLREAERAVRRALALAAESGGPRMAPATVSLDDDPRVACWQLCAAAPLGALDKQVLLAVPGASERLSRLTDLAKLACEMLAYGMAKG
jgi:Lon protease-like protein